MIDIKKLRDNLESVQQALKKRGYDLDVSLFSQLESSRKSLQIDVENLQAERKKLSAEFGKLKSSGKDTDNLKKVIDTKNDQLSSKDAELQKTINQIDSLMLDMPNIPDDSVPEGSDESENVVVKEFGEIISTNKLDHLEIASDIDTELAAKLAGTRFSVLKGDMAKLQRSLISFMLDKAIENGYKEYYVPFMANSESLIGTGQLPKFDEDLFKSTEKLYLIPTAEVPLTNLFRNEFVNERDLPIKVTSHTPCFRSEAGSYGKDTKGLIRQHQFEKIELVQITNPDNSMKCLDGLLNNACEILDLLELPYQVIELCTGDLGFSSAKTFDIEVWMPSQNKYREISSCSNFTDFQARRANIKYKSDNGNNYVHTINGSGLAVGRCLIALIENNFDGSDSVKIPKSLQSYFGSDSLKVN
tara:strand:+ start:6747 stop:7994 length:1248 start_codon:yes stop_codon:yes gene_type:complete